MRKGKRYLVYLDTEKHADIIAAIKAKIDMDIPITKAIIQLIRVGLKK